MLSTWTETHSPSVSRSRTAALVPTSTGTARSSRAMYSSSASHHTFQMALHLAATASEERHGAPRTTIVRSRRRTLRRKEQRRLVSTP